MTATDRIVEALEGEPRWWYGLDLMRATKLSSGSLYPALAALELSGQVESKWADGPPPRRRLYRITRQRGLPVRSGVLTSRA